MPRVKLIGDDGWVALDERITQADLEDEHLRRQLAERLEWAAADAEDRAPERSPAPSSPRRWSRNGRRSTIARPVIIGPTP
jgi:hypothetical protein